MPRLVSTVVLVSLTVFALVGGGASPAASKDESKAIKLTEQEDRVRVVIGGRHFTDYYFAAAKDNAAAGPYVRPYLFPVIGPNGKEMTADQKTSGGDHPHHRSIWVSHGDVNGADHWSLNANPIPKQRHVRFAKVEGDTIVQELEWEGKEGEAGKPILNERRTLRFFVFDDGARGVDLTIALTPAEGAAKAADPAFGDAAGVTFGDTKEAGLCSVRVAPAISQKETVKISNSTGASGESNIWGKPAAWCDISGVIDGQPCGIATLDHPSNPRHPSTWHVREYGLLSANIFGLSAFDSSLPKGAGAFTIKPGETATFRYRVVIHEGDAMSAKLDEKFKQFSGE